MWIAIFFIVVVIIGIFIEIGIERLLDKSIEGYIKSKKHKTIRLFLIFASLFGVGLIILNWKKVKAKIKSLV